MYLITDGNSLGYAGAYAAPLSHKGMKTNAIFHFLKSLWSTLHEEFIFNQPIVLWDRRAQFRFDLYPEYKGNRNVDEKRRQFKEDYKAQAPFIEEALTHLGVPQIHADGYEADDLAGFFVRRSTKQGNRTKLLTADEDWMQLVNGLTVWRDGRNDKFCNASTFQSMTGVDTAEQFIQAKALTGDKSDNIAGVGGIGDIASAAIINEYGNVQEMLKHRPFAKGELPASLSRFLKKINNLDEDIFNRNYKLMNLRDESMDASMAKKIRIDRGKFDLDAFATLCEDLGFNSILLDLNKWASPYSTAATQGA